MTHKEYRNYLSLQFWLCYYQSLIDTWEWAGVPPRQAELELVRRIRKRMARLRWKHGGSARFWAWDRGKIYKAMSS